MKVAIFMGSKSDLAVMNKACDVLDQFEIKHSVFVISAHRAPELLLEKLKDVEASEYDLIISGAGLAAHLPGFIASNTVLPVIGVPLDAKLSGIDALLSILQMPYPIPVATVGIDNTKNAAMLAVTILSIKYPKLKEKLINFRNDMKNKLREELEKGADL